VIKPSLCVVLHDVAPATQGACERLLRAIDDVAEIPRTLLAVPRYHCDPPSVEFEQWLKHRHRYGDEIALHGYTHLDEGESHGILDHLRRHHYTRGEGEFWDLSLPEAMRRLTAGVRWFHRLGVQLYGFVAPAWLIGPGTWEALRWLELSYTCTLSRIVLLPDRHSLRSQSLVYSADSLWRRQASVAWNHTLALLQRRNPVLRLELHPHDVEYPAIRRSWQRLLAAHLREREAFTLAEVADRWRRFTNWDLLDTDSPLPQLEQREGGLGSEQSDRRADHDVARIVQPKYHA